jgi:hypothetical protein
MFSIIDILQVSIGVSWCGAVVLLGLKLLRIITRHDVLLTGQCLGAVSEPAQPGPADPRYPRLFSYRLRIQSLEATTTEYPMQVTVKGFPNGPAPVSLDHHVWVSAGWKPIDVIENLGRSPKGGADMKANTEPKGSGEAADPCLWRAVFQELPAFDAWSFDVVIPCERLEFSLAFLGVEETKLLTPTFGSYFEPDRLTVFASDCDEPRVRGSITMPRPVVSVISSILAVGVYVMIRALAHWRIEWGVLTSRDGWLMGAVVVLILIGYSFIRRPVYPVISGYRFITPPWPVEPGSADKSGSHEDSRAGARG